MIGQRDLSKREAKLRLLLQQTHLLSLPAEIREHVFMFVLGERLIHIKSSISGEIFHSECIAEESEYQAYRKSERDNRTCEERHHQCRRPDVRLP